MLLIQCYLMILTFCIYEIKACIYDNGLELFSLYNRMVNVFVKFKRRFSRNDVENLENLFTLRIDFLNFNNRVTMDLLTFTNIISYLKYTWTPYTVLHHLY